VTLEERGCCERVKLRWERETTVEECDCGEKVRRDGRETVVRKRGGMGERDCGESETGVGVRLGCIPSNQIILHNLFFIYYSF
jgi:hypothetical protein